MPTGFEVVGKIGKDGICKAIRTPKVILLWIRSVIDKMNHYKAEHQRLLNEATTLLEMAMWKANLVTTMEDKL